MTDWTPGSKFIRLAARILSVTAVTRTSGRYPETSLGAFPCLVATTMCFAPDIFANSTPAWATARVARNRDGPPGISPVEVNPSSVASAIFTIVSTDAIG